MTSTIAFPALQVAPRESFLVVPSLLLEATPGALANGYFAGLYLVDSTGTLFRIASVSPVRPLTWIDRLLNRRVSLAISFEDPEPANLALVVKDLCHLIDHDPDDLYEDHQMLKDRICRAGSPAELVAVLNEAASQETAPP